MAPGNHVARRGKLLSSQHYFFQRSPAFPTVGDVLRWVLPRRVNFLDEIVTALLARPFVTPGYLGRDLYSAASTTIRMSFMCAGEMV